MFVRSLCAMFLFVATGAVPAIAADITSVYTKIDLEACEALPAPEEEGTWGGWWMCAGYQGVPVYVAEGDLRMFVSFGPNARNEPAANQTLPNFNTINQTLEWRLRGQVPFATILRWFPQDGATGVTGSILIVTRYRPGSVCQVALIDAQANPNANVLARNAADTMADTFDCRQPPVVIGNAGKFLSY